MELPQTDWSKVPDAVDENSSRFALDSRLHVQFYSRAVVQTKLSEEAGRPIYADVDHVRILTPGDKLSIIDRIASDDDKQRFAAQWEKYRSGKGQDVVGTRLEVVPWLTRAQVEEFKYFHIFTVEQLAHASDEVGQKFPGFQQWKQKAQQFLEATTGDSARIRELEKQLEELKALVKPQTPKLEPEVGASAKSEPAKK